MEAFTLDTAGLVSLPASVVIASGNRQCSPVAWSDLSPFVQGYIEALAEYSDRELGEAFERRHGAGEVIGFSDLSPEALALILKDCEHARASDTAEAGRLFWTMRQGGKLTAFPRLTVSLSDEGKVLLSQEGSAPLHQQGADNG
jgi:hypothetical protein